MIKAKEFVEQYNATDTMMKESFIRDHIVNDYVPYTRKIAKSKNIINATSKTDVDGNSIYCTNSPSRFLLFTMNLIEEYTDIDVTYEDNIVGTFDLLDSNGLVALLLNAMPQNDRKMFQMVFDMVRDDAFESERSLVGWMDNKVNAIKMMINGIPWDEIIEGMVEKAVANNSDVIETK